MRPAVVFGASLLAIAGFVALSGGGESATKFEEVVKEMLATLDKMSVALSAIKDAESAKAARPELKNSVARWQVLRKKAENMKLPSKEEKDRLEKEYRGKIVSAHKKLLGEIGRVRDVPGGKEALQEMRALIEKDKK
jgi:hypothetical protein